MTLQRRDEVRRAPHPDLCGFLTVCGLRRTEVISSCSWLFPPRRPQECRGLPGLGGVGSRRCPPIPSSWRAGAGGTPGALWRVPVTGPGQVPRLTPPSPSPSWKDFSPAVFPATGQGESLASQTRKGGGGGVVLSFLCFCWVDSEFLDFPLE